MRRVYSGSLAKGIAAVLKFLPGTYGTVLLHEHFMGKAIEAMPDVAGLKDTIRSSFDCKIDFFGQGVAQWVSYLVIVGTIAVLVVGYILLLSLRGRKLKKREKV